MDMRSKLKKLVKDVTFTSESDEPLCVEPVEVVNLSEFFECLDGNGADELARFVEKNLKDACVRKIGSGSVKRVILSGHDGKGDPDSFVAITTLVTET